MGKITKLKTKFLDGEKVEGNLTEVNADHVIIETDEKFIHIPLKADICAALENYLDDDIILSKVDGDYEIKEKE